jgi:hypothetical protein
MLVSATLSSWKMRLRRTSGNSIFLFLIPRSWKTSDLLEQECSKIAFLAVFFLVVSDLRLPGFYCRSG